MNKRKLLEKGYNLYCYIASRLPEGYAPLPPVIIWTLTYRCNLRCKMCIYYGQGGEIPDGADELSFDDIINIIDNIKKSYRFYPYKPFIGLIGGEPFIHTRIFDILEYLKKNGFACSVTTNFASLDKEKIERLAKIGLNDLRVSMDGPGEIHDNIRSVKGTFDKMIKNLTYLRRIDKKIPIRLNCVISPMNLDRINEIIPYAKKLNADCSYQHLIFIDDEHRNANRLFSKKILNEELSIDATSMTLSEQNILQLKEKYNEIIDECNRQEVNISFTPDLKPDDFEGYYLNLNGYVHQDQCFWPWGTARITPEGDVHSCMHYIYGNLKTDSFKVIWNNERARKFRSNLKKIKLFPGCIRCCKI